MGRRSNEALSGMFEEKGVLKKKCVECGAYSTLVEVKGVRCYATHRHVVSGRICKMTYQPISRGTPPK